jgi:hypothetical protein
VSRGGRQERGEPVSAAPGTRHAWAVKVAQSLADAIKVAQRERDIEAELILDYARPAFHRAIIAVGNVPGGLVTQRIEDLVIVQGLSVETALRQVGC